MWSKKEEIVKQLLDFKRESGKNEKLFRRVKFFGRKQKKYVKQNAN